MCFPCSSLNVNATMHRGIRCIVLFYIMWIWWTVVMVHVIFSKTFDKTHRVSVSHQPTFVSVLSLPVLPHVANKGKVLSLNTQYEYWTFANNIVYHIEISCRWTVYWKYYSIDGLLQLLWILFHFHFHLLVSATFSWRNFTKKIHVENIMKIKIHFDNVIQNMIQTYHN